MHKQYFLITEMFNLFYFMAFGMQIPSHFPLKTASLSFPESRILPYTVAFGLSFMCHASDTCKKP